MNPLRIPAFILRGLILAAHDNWTTAREIADARRRLRTMR